MVVLLTWVAWVTSLNKYYPNKKVPPGYRGDFFLPGAALKKNCLHLRFGEFLAVDPGITCPVVSGGGYRFIS